MSSPLVGAGFLIANDILTDAAFGLIQPSVNTVVPAGGIAAGARIVTAWDPSMYVGAQLVVGVVNGADIEVVTISSVVSGVSFSAVFANNHAAGEPIVGATFPVRATTGDALFTQSEMIAYLSTAVNDFLTDCPLVYAVTDAVSIAPAAQNTPLPSDCMMPVHIAVDQENGLYPLRETSQSNLDAWDYRWQQQQAMYPVGYFRDKVPLQNFGVWPRANNTVDTEIVYQQRQANTLGLADGFLFPDPFLPYVKARTLSFAFSKDGENRNPGLAKYWATHYEFGVKVSKMILEAINDPNLEMSQ